MKNTILNTSNLTKIVNTGETQLSILKNINMSLVKAHSLAIVGESGSGKSTLLGLLAGLDVPTQGEIYIHNHNITQCNEEERTAIRAQYVSFIFQNFQLLEGMTALENVMLPMEIKQDKHTPVKSIQHKASYYLDLVKLSHRTSHKPNQLSGGEQQRVAIARAFACEAPILFADEPTGNLDTKTGESIIEMLFDLQTNTSTTLVLVTHDIEFASRCDQQIHLHSGELTQPY